MAQKGLLIIVSAPSGAGKMTLLNKVQEQVGQFATTISATTREPRVTEEDGREYYFLTRDDFEKRIAAREFVEWAEVHGNLYGTLACELERCLATGKDVILELDVQGMRSFKAKGQQGIYFFFLPPSLEELERRLRTRGANDEADLALRMKNAEAEMAAKDEYDYIIVNDDLDRAAAEMCAALTEERKKAAESA